MTKALLNTLICILIPVLGWTSTSQLSPRIANYTIKVELDPPNHSLDAEQILVWKNPSTDTIKEMYFHLYYNAFKNSQSTFFKERGVPEFLTSDIDEVCGWGYSEIENIIDGNGNDLSGSMRYYQTDDDNTEDQSVLKIDLVEPVLPGDSISLQMNWRARVPKTMPRTGYNRDYFFFAQWFPKVGVYEPKGMRYAKQGQWNCHQYHSSGEYYADFGNYDLYITVPSDFTVAASGVLQDKTLRDGKQVWHYFAHDVIDFAWAASPQLQLIEDVYGDVDIKFYAYPYKMHIADRYLSTLKFGIQFLEEHLGPYPYKTISIVDTPFHGMFTGGMEYPNLVTSLSFCFFPRGVKTPETLVIHEYIHQYFMQMVATHEVEDPWMDEGFTTYYEGRILDALFGEDRSTIDAFGIKAGNKEYNRIEFLAMDNPRIAPNSIKSWQFKNGGYGEVSYNKTAMWLQTLEGMLGTASMDTMMREYFLEWQFNHPCRDDFIAHVNTYVTQNHGDRFPDGMDWFFSQVLFGTAVCDYGIAAIENDPVPIEQGFFENQDSCEVIDRARPKYRSRVLVHRLGDMYLPTEVRVTYDDNTSKMYYWDGKDGGFAIEWEGDKRILSAEIDPYRKNYLDSNFLNNSMTVQKQSGLLKSLKAGLTAAAQHIIESISFFT
ncbi:MAG: M1 family metallopeptidase [Saprospiraceae bacterium]|nr:M1 family metallopeptidase [Saprospiraceae bacterium]